MTPLQPTLDCSFYNLTLTASVALAPTYTQLVYDALRLKHCGIPPPALSATATAAAPRHSQPPLYVTPVAAEDTDFASLFDALMWRRQHNSSRDIVLKPGVHFLNATIEIDSRDSGMKILGEPGAWLSGGVPLHDLEWSRANDGRDPSLHTNTWAAQLPPTIHAVPSLNLLTPHRRLTRARYPNGDLETVQWGYASPTARDVSLPSKLAVHWWKPDSPLEKPVSTYVNLSDPSNPTGQVKDDSTMKKYNAYGSGRGGLCDEIWDTSTGGSGSYWCGSNAAGGWAEVDAGMASKGERMLPIGLTYNTTAPRLANWSRWKDARGAVVRVWHPQSWFLNFFGVGSHDPTTGAFTFDSGGSQGGRVWCRCDQCDYVCPPERKKTPELASGSWFIENVREELDSSGEWYYNTTTRHLYYWPNGTDAHGPKPSEEVTLVVQTLQTLIRVGGGAKDVEIHGVGFRDTAPTYMEKWGVPSGGDWALYPGGAVILNGTSNVSLMQCNFSRVDGNAVYIGGRNRDAAVIGCDFNWVGDSAIALWGESDEWDATAGAYPNNTRIVNSTFRELGINEKQSSAVFIAKSARTLIERNVMFNLPRAAINVNDGAMGGHLIRHNLIFNTCRESGDHGAINTWDREPFLHVEKGGEPSLEPLPIVIEQNYITANYGSSQGVDNDDGSSWYRIKDNVFYSADGFKMDYGGHDSVFGGNLVIVKPYDGQNCYNVGNFKKGDGDVFSNNTCVIIGCNNPKCVDKVGQAAQCDSDTVSLSMNAYYTQHGNASLTCGGKSYTVKEAQATLGLEKGSTWDVLPKDEEMVKWAKARLAKWL